MKNISDTNNTEKPVKHKKNPRRQEKLSLALRSNLLRRKAAAQEPNTKPENTK